MTPAATPAATPGSMANAPEADSTATGRTKYIFIQDDPFYLPRVLDKYLREFADTDAALGEAA